MKLRHFYNLHVHVDSIFKLRARSFYAYPFQSVGMSVYLSVHLSLEKISKIVKNHEFDYI